MRNLTLALSLTLFTATPALADKNNSLKDVVPPTFELHMVDGANAGPIAWHLPSLPPSLGCAGSYGDGGWDAGWNDRFPNTNFRDPAVQRQAYFFEQDGPFDPHSFYVTAHDNRAVKQIRIIIEERDVFWDPRLPAPDPQFDGPSDFSRFFPTSAYQTLSPVYDGNFFSHWEKRLTVNSSWLVFDVADFGATGRIDVVVEDYAGNISVGSVYLVFGEVCVI